MSISKFNMLLSRMALCLGLSVCLFISGGCSSDSSTATEEPETKPKEVMQDMSIPKEPATTEKPADDLDTLPFGSDTPTPPKSESSSLPDLDSP